LEKSMKDLRIGEKARVERVALNGVTARRFREVGLTEGAAVECVLLSPFGDPAAYLIRGAVMAIRDRDSEQVIVNNE